MINDDEEIPQSAPVSLQDFEFLKILGKGNFGKVYLTKNNLNGQLYAIKVIRKDVLLEYNQIEGTILEKNIMTKSRHPFLVSMEHLFASNNRLFFVMPYICGGELY